ncbi:MAG: hypothetical protein IPK01_13350 [Acidobacteria bacterium]|nr:hypothetical protein [Acidobacteriota bacterium]
MTRVLCSQVSGPATAALTGCTQGFQNVANNSQVSYDVSTRTTFDADAGFVGLNAGGRHNIKFGYQLNRLFNTVDRGYADLGLIQLFYGPFGQRTLTVSNPVRTALPDRTCSADLAVYSDLV